MKTILKCMLIGLTIGLVLTCALIAYWTAIDYDPWKNQRQDQLTSEVSAPADQSTSLSTDGMWSGDRYENQPALGYRAYQVTQYGQELQGGN